MEYIRKHACEGIVPMDVVRIGRVKELLRNSKVDVSVLPDLCGYASLVDLRRAFKRLTGMTIREYQKRRCNVL